MTKPKPLRYLFQGFTLLELLIVVFIISVLATLAAPSYTSYFQRAHRSEARVAILKAAQWMERAATANGSYPGTADIPPGLVQVPGNHYLLRIVSPDPSQSGTNTFRITASRSKSGIQASDACGNFVLDQTGKQEIIQATPGTSASTCWGH